LSGISVRALSLGEYHSMSRGIFFGGGVFGYPNDAAIPSHPGVVKHGMNIGVAP
jgi:hypothetical protein